MASSCTFERGSVPVLCRHFLSSFSANAWTVVSFLCTSDVLCGALSFVGTYLQSNVLI